ncbi:MAG: hypothetical protein JNN27_06090 [Planctomycetes bacterium]|nr:hypothetical protein [Planctomycetota bacterium]
MKALLLCAFTALCCALPAHAGDQTQMLGSKVELRAWSRWPAHAQGGWAPLFVDVTNRDATPQRVAVEVRRNTWRGDWTCDLALEVPAGETRRVEVLVPLAVETPNNVNVVATLGSERAWISGAAGASDTRSGVRAILLCSEVTPAAGDVEQWEFAVSTEAATGASPGSPYPGDVNLALARRDELSALPAAYSCLDLVVIDSGSPWPGEREFAAIAAWMRSGGDVLVLGPNAQRLAAAQPALATWMEPRFDISEVSTPPEPTSPRRSYRAALGRLSIAEGDELFPGAEPAWIHELLNSRSLAKPAGSHSRAPNMLAKLQLAQLPYRVFAVLLIGFAVLIGPVNFFVVSKRKRPALLLFTIPAISVAVTVLLLVYGILYQGLDVKTASWSTTVLDQRAHTASTIERRQLFAGLSPADGLRPTTGTVVQQLDGGEGGPFAFNADGFELRTRHGQEWLLTGDFLPARRAIHQLITSDRAERGRLEVEFGADGVQVLNNLGVALESVSLRDAAGNAFELRSELGVGARATLTPLDPLRVEELGDELQRTSIAWGPPGALSQTLAPPGCYLAKLARGAYLDSCGIEVNEQSGHHVLFGVLELPAEVR